MRIKTFILINIILFSLKTFSQDFLGDNRTYVKSELKQRYSGPSYKLEFKETVIKVDTIHKFAISDEELQKKIAAYGTHYFDSLYKIPTVIIKIDTLTKLEALINGFEKITIEFYFEDQHDAQFNRKCDSVVIKYYDKNSADRNIKLILSNDLRQWKKLSKTSYVSRFQTNQIFDDPRDMDNPDILVGSPKMNIVHQNESINYTMVILYTPMMKQKAWKILTK